ICVICEERLRTKSLLPCKHVAMCDTCSYRVTRCPVCREPITHRLNVIIS
ncbi:unnamed protein product, partial [Ectocarpus sp. 12 AP-2014]